MQEHFIIPTVVSISSLYQALQKVNKQLFKARDEPFRNNGWFDYHRRCFHGYNKSYLNIALFFVFSIEDLVPLNNLLILKHLDISHNQILGKKSVELVLDTFFLLHVNGFCGNFYIIFLFPEVESVSASVTKCVHLESLSVAGNPFTELTDLK